jgi:hypothetical protein
MKWKGLSAHMEEVNDRQKSRHSCSYSLQSPSFLCDFLTDDEIDSRSGVAGRPPREHFILAVQTC